MDLTADEAEDSYSFLSLLLGEETLPRSNLIHKAWNKNTLAIRERNWKLIPFKGSGTNDIYPVVEEEGQLYNLNEDPAETVNLYDQYPEIVLELRRTLDRIRKKPN